MNTDKAKQLAKQYFLEHGMDADDIRACTVPAEGFALDIIEWLLDKLQPSEPSEFERLKEKYNKVPLIVVSDNPIDGGPNLVMSSSGPSTEISDEEIENWAKLHSSVEPDYGEEQGRIWGAKWYRDEMKKRSPEIKPGMTVWAKETTFWIMKGQELIVISSDEDLIVCKKSKQDINKYGFQPFELSTTPIK